MAKEVIYLDFEEEIKEIDLQINELKVYSTQKGISYRHEIRDLEKERIRVISRIYNNLTPWNIVQISRHPYRPILGDYIKYLFDDFKELHGDKSFGDDRSLICGLCKINFEKVMLIGHNKGRSTEENIERNFGSPHPEGYKKALMKMKFAEKFKIPIITLIDTPGAYPGVGGEERGIFHAIANNLMEMSRIKVPIISVVIGEGGSGGALGIGVSDRLSMFQYSYYSVISPEGCAAILWKDASYASEAAESLKLTSRELLKLGLIDDIIKEPFGGSHNNLHDAVFYLKSYLLRTLRELRRKKLSDLLEERYEKLRNVGKISQESKK